MRPRYARIGAALTSTTVTAVALLGASGVIPTGSGAGGGSGPVRLSGYSGPTTRIEPGPAGPAPSSRDDTAESEGAAEHPAEHPAEAARVVATLPADSGTGRRVVFDISEQRVWLVAARGGVRRSYLVSGSLTDNLDPGSYEVYSTSRNATGIDDSGTMRYMVRFAHGSRAAIGFHDIPLKDGKPVQSRADLGEPQSHGCIRQWRPDARALWDFAPVGTKVVVVG